MVAIGSFGSNAAIGGQVFAKLQPEFEIVHAALDLATAKSELAPLAGGDTSISPSSNLGTNAGKDAGARQVPKAIIIGGGVPEAEVAEFKAALAAAAPGVPAIQVNRAEIAAAGGSGPDPELISKLLKEKLSALGL